MNFLKPPCICIPYLLLMTLGKFPNHGAFPVQWAGYGIFGGGMHVRFLAQSLKYPSKVFRKCEPVSDDVC